jgi:hypothetical protein
MTIYVDPDGNYPRYAGDIAIAHPSWATGDPAPQGWVRVAEVEPPVPTESTYVYEEFPIMIGDVLTQNWVSRSLSEEELLQASVSSNTLPPYLGLGASEEILGITSI